MVRFFCASPGLYKATDLLKHVSVTVKGAEVELRVIKKKIQRRSFYLFNNGLAGCGRGSFPGGPVVKNRPSNKGDSDLIPRWGIKIPHAWGNEACALQLERPRAAISEHTSSRAHGPQQGKPRTCTPQLEKARALQQRCSMAKI